MTIDGMTARLESKVIVVTGGSSGIGRAVAERVASEGAAVVIGARRKDLGEEVAAAIRAAGGGGAIVNNASLAGVRGISTMPAYVAAKHGVVGLTRAAALECARRGVRVNALVTGNVDTPLYRGLLGVPLEGDLEVEGMNPSGRVSRPEEIAAFVAFLLSDEASFITGAALAIDGGATAQ